MASITKLIVLLAFVSSSLAAVSLGPARTNPEYPGMCWIPKLNKAFEIGATWQEPNCVRVICLSYKSRLFVEYASCGVVAAGPGCVTQQDLSLPYPSCCPVVTCLGPDPAALSGDEYHKFNNLIGGHLDRQTAIS